jgi:hypothetical protein
MLSPERRGVEDDFYVVCCDNIPPVETSVGFTLVETEEGDRLFNERTRLASWSCDDSEPQLDWVDSEGNIRQTPVAYLPGFTCLGLDPITAEPVVAFRYFKQFEGTEAQRRIVRLKGIAYGVHEGHMGDSEKKIEPEKPGWYIIAEQLGSIDDNNEFKLLDVPVGRVFPFARIMGGPLGDPTNPAVRQRFGLY